MASPKNKIIQKRVRKRERYARMARIRHRREKNVFLAKPQDLADNRSLPAETKIYHFSTGMVVGETNNRIDLDMSLMNKNYISNCVSVMEETDKLVCVQLHKKTNNMDVSDEEILTEWESREDPYWKECASKFRLHLGGCQKFITDNVDKFNAKKVDKVSIERCQTYADLRKDKLSNLPCMEKRIRFDANYNFQSEVIFNSKFISILNYNLEEFVDKILREGIPNIKHPETKICDNEWFNKCLPDFSAPFLEEKPLVLPDKEMILLAKDQTCKKVKATMTRMGYFVKHAAELNFVVTIEELETLDLPSPIPLNQKTSEELTEQELERKAFLDMYYPKRSTDFEEEVEEERISVKSEEITPLSNSLKINTVSTNETINNKIQEENQSETLSNLSNHSHSHDIIKMEPTSPSIIHIPKASYPKNGNQGFKPVQHNQQHNTLIPLKSLSDSLLK